MGIGEMEGEGIGDIFGDTIILVAVAGAMGWCTAVSRPEACVA